jgi:hypothetical protein
MDDRATKRFVLQDASECRQCRCTVQWRESIKTSGATEKSRVITEKSRVIYGVPSSENNVYALQTPAQ